MLAEKTIAIVARHVQLCEMAFYGDSDFFYISGTVDCSKTLSGFNFSHKFDFMNRNSANIAREELQSPLSENWEIGLTEIEYKYASNKVVSLPTPSLALANGTYHLYDMEFMLGPLLFFPVGMSFDELATDFITKLYNISDPGLRSYISDNYTFNCSMYKELLEEIVVNGQEHYEKFYFRSMDSPTLPGDEDLVRSPIIRGNILDRAWTLFQSEFRNNYISLTFLEFLDLCEPRVGRLLTEDQIKHCDHYLQKNLVGGFKRKDYMFGKRSWNSVQNLPKFNLTTCSEDDDDAASGGTSSNSSSKYPCIEIKCPLSTVYIACGEAIKNIMGFESLNRTQKLFRYRNDSVGTKTKIGLVRDRLHIIYDSFKNYWTAPCTALFFKDQLEDPYIAPKWSPEENPEKTHTSASLQWLWCLPHLSKYNVDYTEYKDFLLSRDATYETINVYSDNLINNKNSGNIYIYSNVCASTYHIGNYLSPYLANIPAPTFGFAIPNLDLTKGETLENLSLTHEIENTIYIPVKKNINLEDMMVDVLNNYGDKINAGVLFLYFIIRRSTKTW